MNRKTIYITSGAPCAGKTTFINQRIEALDGVRISRDEIRLSMLAPGDFYFKNENKVFETFIHKIQEAIDNPRGKKEIYIDATHLNKKARNKVINRLNLENVDTIIVLLFDIPLEELLIRNKKRNNPVPEDAIERMKNSMDAPTRNEEIEYLARDNVERVYFWKIDKDGWIEDFDIRSENA